MRILLSLVATCALSGCVGAAINTATDAAIAVGKVPFKVGGAVIDVATPDKKRDKDDQESE